MYSYHCASTVYAVLLSYVCLCLSDSVCLCMCVCPSHAGIVSKLLNIVSRKQLHMIAQGL